MYALGRQRGSTTPRPLRRSARVLVSSTRWPMDRWNAMHLLIRRKALQVRISAVGPRHLIIYQLQSTPAWQVRTCAPPSAPAVSPRPPRASCWTPPCQHLSVPLPNKVCATSFRCPVLRCRSDPRTSLLPTADSTAYGLVDAGKHVSMPCLQITRTVPRQGTCPPHSSSPPGCAPGCALPPMPTPRSEQ